MKVVVLFVDLRRKWPEAALLGDSWAVVLLLGRDTEVRRRGPERLKYDQPLDISLREK